MANKLQVEIVGNAAGLDQALQQARRSVDQFRAQAAAMGIQVSKHWDDVSLKVKSVGDSARSAGTSVDVSTASVVRGVGAVELLRRAYDKIKDTIREAVDQVLAYERAVKTMQYATGNSAAGMAFVRKTAAELGLELSSTAQGYAQLAASAKGTSLEGQATQDIFWGVAKAASVMGLGADETNGMIVALGQMMSKGKVQAEELRKQLGERLPGAFAMAARAMGVSTAELDKMLSEGKIFAEDFLPKFAQELKNTFGGSSSEGTQASINRLKTAWTDLVLEVSKQGGMDVLTASVGGLTTALRALVDSGAIREISQFMGSTIVQVTALAGVLNFALAPAFAYAATQVRIFLDLWKVQMALAAMQGTTGLSAMVGAIQRFVNPWVIAVGAMVAVGYGLSRWAQSYSRDAADLAEAKAQETAQFTASTRALVDQSGQAERLEATIRSTAQGTSAHTNARRQLNQLVRDAIQQYPDLIRYLKKEADGYTDVSGAMQRYGAGQLRQLQIRLEEAERAAAVAAGEKTDALDHNIVSYGLVYKGIAENAEREEAALRRTADEIRKQIDTIKAWQANEPTKPLAKDQKDTISKAEHEARLQAWQAEGMERASLAQQAAAQVAKIEADLTKELARLAEERAKGKFAGLPSGAYEAERQAAMAGASRQILQVEAETATKRQALEERLQAELTQVSEQGLEARLAAIRKKFVGLEKEARQAGVDPAGLADAQAMARGRAMLEQVRADRERLRQEMSQQAEITGPMSRGEQLAFLDEAAKRSTSYAIAAQGLKEQLHLVGSAQEGWLAGLRDFSAQASTPWQTWRQTAIDCMQGVQNAFASGIQGLLSGQMSLGKAMSTIWKGIVSTVIQAVAQMVAQWIAAGIASLLFKKQTAAGAASQAAASQAAAAAGIFAAHSGIPYVGPAIAAGLVAMMQTVLAANMAASIATSGKIAAFASGGRIDKPTLALMGEVPGSAEIVAPERTFRSWADDLTRNIVASQMRTQAYRVQASGYAQQASGQMAGGYHINDMRGAVIVADERTLANLHRNGRNALGSLEG